MACGMGVCSIALQEFIPLLVYTDVRRGSVVWDAETANAYPSEPA